MSIITISRGSYSYGKIIAEEVAKKLGYTCIARDVLLEASKDFNLPEIKFLRAINDAPSILDRVIDGKEKYIAYIQAALLKHLHKDNVVYHGLAGHFFVKDLPHALKIRINAEVEDRVKISRERHGISRKEALRSIKKLDKQRNKWSKHLYGIDTLNSSLYDLVIQIGKIMVDDAVDIICNTVRLERFQTTPESQQAMDDLRLSAEVRAALIGIKRDIQVSAQNGVVHVKATTLESKEFELAQNIKQIAEKIPDVKDVKINVISIPTYVHH